MVHPQRLIPPPSGGSSGYFTSPARGRAKRASAATVCPGGSWGAAAHILRLAAAGISLRPSHERPLLDLTGARQRTTPERTWRSSQSQEPGRAEQRHEVEPDVARCDPAGRVAVRDPEPGQLRGPAPGPDGRAVQLERGHDEKDAGVGRTRTRPPEKGEQERDAESSRRVGAGEHGEPEQTPCGRNRAGCDDERACVTTERLA